MHKLIRITTIPLSLEKLLEGQLAYMNQFYEVTAISAEQERLEKYGNDNGVNTYWVNLTREITPVKDMMALFRMYRFFKKEKPLIVHTHTPKAGIVGMMAAKMAGVPIRLHTVAGLPLMETTGLKRKLLNWVEKLTYSYATKVYPNSRGMKEIILEEGFCEESKLKVLGKGSSNGIDTEYFDPHKYSREDSTSMRKELNIPVNDIVFIFIGRLVREKGINELVSAFQRLKEEHNNISLLLVGPFEEDLDPLTPDSMKLIKENSKIFTTGYQQDVRPYLALSDVLAFPSYREGFPNVVMQAGAMNLPSIVTDINGCNEIIVEGLNGVIIPVKDEGALLTSMELMLENKNYRKRLAGNSREQICKFYDRHEFWEVLLREYKKLESEILKS